MEKKWNPDKLFWANETQIWVHNPKLLFIASCHCITMLLFKVMEKCVMSDIRGRIKTPSTMFLNEANVLEWFKQVPSPEIMKGQCLAHLLWTWTVDCWGESGRLEQLNSSFSEKLLHVPSRVFRSHGLSKKISGDIYSFWFTNLTQWMFKTLYELHSGSPHNFWVK